MPDFRIIPSIDQLRQRPGVMQLEDAYGAGATMQALRHSASALREQLGGSEAAAAHDVHSAAAWIEQRAARHLGEQFRGSLRPVLNATGVIVHTNLGRAPIAEAALRRLRDVARGYCNLEYDLGSGHRGSRSVHAASLLTALSGAEAAVVVNNNAAATMLILAALGSGREVIISRGELVEIGGGFRVPDVMTQSGAVLREVGTTNRTRAADYQAAISARTAMLLRVHPSNFRIEGFTERPALSALVRVAHDAHLPLVEDLGSGLLLPSVEWETSVQSSIAAGADLVCFSGDKLLGGPQAGIIAGRRDLVERLQRHPLMRAVRVDKLILAALEATLLEYLAGRASDTVPVVRMIATTVGAIEQRAQHLASRLRDGGWAADLTSGSSAVGGGSAPGVDLPTVLVAVERRGWSAARLEQQLRQLTPPVLARIEQDHVVLDLRTIDPADDVQLGDLLEAIA